MLGGGFDTSVGTGGISSCRCIRKAAPRYACATHHVLPVQPAHEPATARQSAALQMGCTPLCCMQASPLKPILRAKLAAHKQVDFEISSVHPLHRAENLTGHNRSCRSRTRTYTSPTRRALLVVASWSASARAHRFRQPRRRRARLAMPHARQPRLELLKPLLHHQSAHPRPHICAPHTRAPLQTGWLADHVTHVCALAVAADIAPLEEQTDPPLPHRRFR